MPTQTVWRYPTAYGAEEGELRVKMLRDRGAVVVHDTSDVDMDVVRETFPEGDAELMYTDLAAEDEDALRALTEDRQMHNERTGGAADG